MTQSNIIMYTTEDGVTKIEVAFDHDTVVGLANHFRNNGGISIWIIIV